VFFIFVVNFVANFVDPSRSFISDKVYDKVRDKVCLQLGVGIGIEKHMNSTPIPISATASYGRVGACGSPLLIPMMAIPRALARWITCA